MNLIEGKARGPVERTCDSHMTSQVVQLRNFSTLQCTYDDTMTRMSAFIVCSMTKWSPKRYITSKKNYSDNKQLFVF